MVLEELRSPTGKTYLLISRPDQAPWVYADWVGYPTANNVSTGGLAYLTRMQEQKLHGVLNDNRHLVGRWDSSLEWLRQNWLPHAVQCGLRYWAHLDNPGAMSVESANGLRKLVDGKFEIELFTDLAAAEKWLRAGLARR